MLLDDQCSCSGVITVTRKGQKQNINFQKVFSNSLLLFKEFSAQDRTAFNYCIPCIWDV